MANKAITPKQMKRLQTLYGQRASHAIEGNSREVRVAWAVQQVGRQIVSFKDLTADEAKRLIDGLQGELGMRAPYKGRPRRDQARRAGLDGRHDGTEFKSAPQIASAEDLARIQLMLQRLEWSQERLHAFLASPRGPLGRRSDKAIRTSADANKVWWALKRIAKSQGKWEERSR